MAEATNGNGNGRVLAPLLSGLAIVLGMTAAITPLYYQSQTHDAMLKEVRDIFTRALELQHGDAVAAAYHRGQVDEKLSSLQQQQDKNGSSIVDLDNRLQRKMRDLDAIQDAKLQGLDERLQGEIRTVSQLQQSDINANRVNADSQQTQQVRNQVSIAELRQRLSAIESKP